MTKTELLFDIESTGLLRQGSTIHCIVMRDMDNVEEAQVFDYKPELVKHNGEPCPKDYLDGRRFAFTSGVPKLLGTPRQFKRHGESGIWMSDALPKLSQMADDLTVIKSLHTEQFNHAPAQLMLYTGSPRMGRPSLGSWVTYGLGSEGRDLPGFIVGRKTAAALEVDH